MFVGKRGSPSLANGAGLKFLKLKRRLQDDEKSRNEKPCGLERAELSSCAGNAYVGSNAMRSL